MNKLALALILICLPHLTTAAEEKPSFLKAIEEEFAEAPTEIVENTVFNNRKAQLKTASTIKSLFPYSQPCKLPIREFIEYWKEPAKTNEIRFFKNYAICANGYYKLDLSMDGGKIAQCYGSDTTGRDCLFAPHLQEKAEKVPIRPAELQEVKTFFTETGNPCKPPIRKYMYGNDIGSGIRYRTYICNNKSELSYLRLKDTAHSIYFTCYKNHTAEKTRFCTIK